DQQHQGLTQAEALAERALLLKTAPHLVSPLPFFLPVYEGDKNGRGILSLGLWLYDLLALFRTPGFHQRLSKESLLKEMPFLKPEGLKGGFRYFDASMWDDVLAVENLRAASFEGAAVANYVQAVAPIWDQQRVAGFRIRDGESGREIALRSHTTIVCAGPWTDALGFSLSSSWPKWLNLSKGVHLVFDLKRIPVTGAMVMSHPSDGRIAFVIPRPDYGSGVVIVGTTDSEAHEDPEKVQVNQKDVDYLMDLLRRYYPGLGLTHQDILSAYVGVRPLMAAQKPKPGDSQDASRVLQKVSREHHIDLGPGGVVVVAGGKYTTARRMAQEIVEFTLSSWKKRARQKRAPEFPSGLKRPLTRQPVNPTATPQALRQARLQAAQRNWEIPEVIYSRYGAQALTLYETKAQGRSEADLDSQDPEGFPWLEAQLRHSIRTEMVMRLEDFYFRRVPLFASRKDHGMPWAKRLAQIWAEERGVDLKEVELEIVALQSEFARRSKVAHAESK
ncbi:MAG: glycerol-3-phosphate dehydrogenase/oxidase, partial [Bdellovibrionia bacterium]